jgi:hypothetical protein
LIQVFVIGYGNKRTEQNTEYFTFYSLFFYFYFSIFLKHYALIIFILKLYIPYLNILISGWNKRIKSGREGTPFLKVQFLKIKLFIYFKKINEEIKRIFLD